MEVRNWENGESFGLVRLHVYQIGLSIFPEIAAQSGSLPARRTELRRSTEALKIRITSWLPAA